MAIVAEETGVRRGRPPGLAPRRPCKIQVAYSEAERQALEVAARAEGADSLAQFIRARTVGRGEGLRTLAGGCAAGGLEHMRLNGMNVRARESRWSGWNQGKPLGGVTEGREKEGVARTSLCVALTIDDAEGQPQDPNRPAQSQQERIGG